MAFTPVAGPVAILKIGTTTVPGINWKLNIDGKLANVSNFRDGRWNAETLDDVDLSFSVVWDAAAPPSDTNLLDLRPGITVAAKCFTDSTHFFLLNAIVGTVEPGIDSMESVIMYPVTAKIQGSITWPVNFS